MSQSNNKRLLNQNESFRNEVYNYLSSIKFQDQPSKKLYKTVAHCSLESEKKKDNFKYCSTCFTTNTNQWKLQLLPRKKISKKLRRKKFGEKKVNKIVLICRICKKQEQHVCCKPSSL